MASNFPPQAPLQPHPHHALALTSRLSLVHTARTGQRSFPHWSTPRGIPLYTAVIPVNKEWTEPVYTEHWLNRAAVSLKLRAYKYAEDADEVIRRERSAKALYRHGRARRSLGRRACRYTRSLAT